MEERLKDLEHHMLQVMDMCLELEKTVHHQAKMIRLLSKVVSELGKAENTKGHRESEKA